MQIAQVIGGLQGLGGADLLRRAMVKKIFAEEKWQGNAPSSKKARGQRPSDKKRKRRKFSTCLEKFANLRFQLIPAAAYCGGSVIRRPWLSRRKPSVDNLWWCDELRYSHLTDSWLSISKRSASGLAQLPWGAAFAGSAQ